MKITTACFVLIGSAVLAAAPAMATCSTGCHLQSKKPSTSSPGKFDYVFSCIDDSSGDEITSRVTAAKDDEAKVLAQKKC